MFTRKTIPFVIGSILLVAVAFLFLTRALDWTYVSELYKDEPAIIMEPEAVEVQTVELEVSVMLDQQKYDELVLLSQRVSDRYPHIHVTFNNLVDQQMSFKEWESETQLGRLGDIQLVPNEWVVPLAIKGFYQPVDRLMNNDVLTDQLPSVIDALRWNGYLWAVPYETNPYLIFIHQKAYEGLDIKPVVMAPPVVLDNSLALKDVSGASTFPDDQSAQGSDVTLPWGFTEWLERYEATAFNGPLLSWDEDQLSSMLAWLSIWREDNDQPMKLSELSEQQLKALQYLKQHPEFVRQSIDWDEEELPLLYMTTVADYFMKRDRIDAHYASSAVAAPLPWLNGKSFMMSSHTVHSEAAMLWIETMNRYQPESTVIHRKMYSTYSSDSMQHVLRELLQQKLLNRQLFAVDLEWVNQYEQLDIAWKAAVTIEEKLALLLEKADAEE